MTQDYLAALSELEENPELQWMKYKPAGNSILSGIENSRII